MAESDVLKWSRPRWTDAWQELVYRHTPFRPVENEDFQVLLTQFAELERLFLNTRELEPYYRECMGLADATLAQAEATDLARHVVAMQLQLFEDVFFSLRLDQYANAPDNRGWMNLFRRWGNSRTFLRHVAELESTFSRAAMQFFEHYIHGWPPDIPVPHRWDVATHAARPLEATYAGRTSESLMHCRRTRASGIFLDPGRREVDQPAQVEEPVVKSQHGETGLPGETSAPMSPPRGESGPPQEPNR